MFNNNMFKLDFRIMNNPIEFYALSCTIYVNYLYNGAYILTIYYCNWIVNYSAYM